ncbi:unnamed protein product [Ceutorhynchus assimilis]|uniref:C2H2-type domain-containing protein n=1 Tax=Ceutorhynchus assimilis TaxID=467358 RepID=A0A9N9MR04_9CUCU|nr:unnamed protein product [Ceutorhynchus assimilis]
MDVESDPSAITIVVEEEDGAVAVPNAQEEYHDYQVLEEIQIEKVEAEESADEDEEGIFDCKYCKFQTKNIEELDEHIIGHEEIEEEESAEEDGGDLPEQEKSENATEFPIPQEHQKYPTFYEEFRNKPVKNIFACPFCGYQSMKKLDMNQHIRDHRSPVELPVYSCSECFYTTFRKFDMPKHLLTHCDNYPKYECKECPYATKRKSDLNKHIIGHTTKTLSKRLFPCHMCSYSTTRRGDLKRHLLSHQVNKSLFIFNCTECGYSAKRLNDLNKHMALHCDRTVEGILKCPKCDYATIKASPFARHILSQCQTRESPEAYQTEQTNENLEQDVDKCNGSQEKDLSQHLDEYIVEDDGASHVVEIVEENYENDAVVVLEQFES